MKYGYIIMAIIIIILLALLIRHDKTCKLENVSNDEIISTAQSTLAKLNCSKYLRDITINEITWYLHNEPEMVKRYLSIYKLSESYK